MTPTNTTKQVKSDPSLMAMEIMIGGTSNAIEKQEARGQAELVRSEVLPTDGIETVRKMIESNGGSIGDKVDGDEMFTNVTLPSGWEKRPTDHSMWSRLHDENGYERASIFYKAAFYDRSAHVSANRRFAIDRYGHRVDGEVRASVEDAKGEVDFATDIVKLADGENEWNVRDRLEAEVKLYLDTNFPEWQSTESYWS